MAISLRFAAINFFGAPLGLGFAGFAELIFRGRLYVPPRELVKPWFRDGGREEKKNQESRNGGMHIPVFLLS
jgi:hypothetical protein